VTCTECQDLKRHLIVATSEHRDLQMRIKSRHPSPPERRRLQRLKADAYLARQLYLIHRATCKEAVP
jgi:hypothetical protein